MITVAGGTGLVGHSLVHDLLKQGAQVRILTRDPNKAKQMFANSKVEIVGVDFDNTGSLKAGFKGSESAFLSMGASDRQVRDEIAQIDAAVDAGVPYLVNLSIGGSGQGIPANVLEWHSEIDAHLKKKNVISTLVRPSTFVDTVIHVASNFVPAGAWGGTAGSGRASLIDTRDIAAVAATILKEGPGKHGGKAYDLTGPTAVSMLDIAGYISQGLGKPVEYHVRTAKEQTAVLESVGLPKLMVEILLTIDEATRLSLYGQPNSTVQQLTGREPQSPQAYVQANISKFKTPTAA